MKNESEVIHSLSLPAGLSQWIDDVVRDLPSPEWQDFYRAQLADKILRIFSGYMAETSDSQLSEAQTLREIGYVTEVQEQIKNELAGKTAYENSRLWKIPLRISVIFLIIGCFSFPLLPYIISNYGKFSLLKNLQDSIIGMFVSVIGLISCLLISYYLKKKYN